MQAAATATNVSIHTILCYFRFNASNEPLLGLSIFVVIKRLGMENPAGHLHHERAQYGITVHSVPQPFLTRGFLCTLLFSWYAEADLLICCCSPHLGTGTCIGTREVASARTPGVVRTISRYRQNSTSRSSLRRMSEGRSSRAFFK